MRSLAFLVLLVTFAYLLGRAYDTEYASGQRLAPAPRAHAVIGDGTLIRAVRAQRIRTWRCQNQTLRRRTPTSYAAERSTSVEFRKWAHRLWRSRARMECNLARQVGDIQAWLCIHRYEGAWTDDGAPYWGGLQMDYGFQATYGGYLLRAKGTANHWTPLEQIIVAERARRSGRGYHPWPHAARLCGLL